MNGDTPASGVTPGDDAEAAPSLLTFPVDFPIKIMGRSVEGFAEAMVTIVQQHAPRAGFRSGDPGIPPVDPGQLSGRDGNDQRHLA